MSKSPEKLHEELTKKLVTENYVDLKPINKIESTAKEPFWKNFEKFLAEGDSLNPIVNTEEKVNTKEEDEKIKNNEGKFTMETKETGTYKVSKSVENIESHNYDYDPKVENINNVNAQELLNGVQCEINYNKELTLDEAKEIAIKNLAKDPLHYVKEGQFGIKGLGYEEQKISENDGENYGGSGYSEKVKDTDNAMQVVKESKEESCCPKEQINEQLGGIVTSGNPHSLAAMSGEVIRNMMAEKEEKELPMDEVEDEGTAVSYSDTYATMEAEKRPDYPDVDKDGDREESMEKALKDKESKKRMKKENIETKLAEIGKAADITKMEAQLEFLTNHITEKEERVNSINEDDNLKELVDKKKMKDMQREIKLLEKRKSKMEKMYEKMSGKSFSMESIINENEPVEIPNSIMVKINSKVIDVKSASQAMLDFYEQMKEKENIDFSNNAKFKIALDNFEKLAQAEVEAEDE